MERNCITPTNCHPSLLVIKILADGHRVRGNQGLFGLFIQLRYHIYRPQESVRSFSCSPPRKKKLMKKGRRDSEVRSEGFPSGTSRNCCCFLHLLHPRMSPVRTTQGGSQQRRASQGASSFSFKPSVQNIYVHIYTFMNIYICVYMDI